MASKPILKNVRQESRLFTDRVMVAWFLMVLLLLVVVARLAVLQVAYFDYYTTQSEKNRQRIQPIPPTRGLIFDRNGEVLADNQPSFTLQVIPEKSRDLAGLIQQLDAFFGLTPGEKELFFRQVRQKRRFDTVPLRSQLTPREVARFSVQRHRFPGVLITSNLMRHYPFGPQGVHAIGYVGRINEKELKRIDNTNYSGTQYIGKTGVEAHYEDTLHGTVGHRMVETNVQGRVLRVLDRLAPIPGKNLHMNLDIPLQIFAERILAGEKAALVALEPASGGVLALVSTPTFDPNMFVVGLDSATYRVIRQAADNPLFNRAVRGRYPPGSTIKPVVGLAGLDHRVRGTHDHVYCRGWYQIVGQDHKYRDWKRSGHGYMNYLHAVEQSCDVYFYDLAQDLGIDRLSAFLGQFGLGRKTMIDLNGERQGILPSRAWKRKALGTVWYPGETLIAGIGQGYMLATPLQLAVMTATIANRGQVLQPRLVFALEDTVTGQMEVIPPKRNTQVEISDLALWDEIIASMTAVTHGARGTARHLGLNSPYRMAGKTGTAQVVGIAQDKTYDADKLDKKYHDHALFIGFAPVESPTIAVAVIVENGGSGSRGAAPVAKEIMDFYLLGDQGIGTPPEP